MFLSVKLQTQERSATRWSNTSCDLLWCSRFDANTKISNVFKSKFHTWSLYNMADMLATYYLGLADIQWPLQQLQLILLPTITLKSC